MCMTVHYTDVYDRALHRAMPCTAPPLIQGAQSSLYGRHEPSRGRDHDERCLLPIALRVHSGAREQADGRRHAPTLEAASRRPRRVRARLEDG